MKNEVVINRFNSDKVVILYSNVINSYNILYPEKYPDEIKNLNRFGIQRAILYWFANCVFYRKISSESITVNNKTDCFYVAGELLQRSVLFGVAVLPGSSKPHNLDNNFDFFISDIKIAFQNSSNQETVFWNKVDKIIDSAIRVKKFDRVNFLSSDIKIVDNDLPVNNVVNDAVKTNVQYIDSNTNENIILENENIDVKERMPFWKLWFRCLLIVFLIGCILGFLSAGETGLAASIGAGIILAPIKSFVIACIIRLFQRVFG